MKIKIKTIEQRMKNFQKVCRESGIKLTPQRQEIFREIAQTGDHPDAESIHKRIRERMPMVSLDTVYRTLWLLKDLKLITTLGTHHDRTRFDANLDHHHHFFCTQCGITQDFYLDELDNIHIQKKLKSIGTVETARVEVRGICKQCESKNEVNI